MPRELKKKAGSHILELVSKETGKQARAFIIKPLEVGFYFAF